MLVGDSNQLDYSRTFERANPQEKIKIAQQLTNNASTGGSGMIPAAGQAMSSLGLASMSHGASPSENKSEDPNLLEEGVDLKPQLLYTKFQRLKNTAKVAKVVLVDEMPVSRSQRNGHTQATAGSEDKPANTRQSYSEEASQELSGSA